MVKIRKCTKQYHVDGNNVRYGFNVSILINDVFTNTDIPKFPIYPETFGIPKV